MKILMFTNSLAGGGAERAAVTLANFWARQGRDVTIVTLNPASEDFYIPDPRVRRMSLNLSGGSSNVFHALLRNARCVAALRRILLQIRPAVVFSMMSTPNVILAFASRGIANLCTIGSERCYPPHAPLGRIWGALRSRMYGRLSAVVALTNECAEWIRANSSATRVAVIPNATVWPLPANTPRIDPHALCLSGRKVLLAVGRLDAVKNFRILISAFSELAEKYADWDLVILGEGPERELLELAIRDQALGDRVLVPGVAGNVGEWYGRADLYVMTSRSEGFPNALAEALSHGLAAVSFDCDTGPRDIIRHGIDGLLVPADNSKALTDALDRVMGDDHLRRQFALRACDARERFSTERIGTMWEELFVELSGARSLAKASSNTRVPKGGAHEF